MALAERPAKPHPAGPLRVSSSPWRAPFRLAVADETPRKRAARQTSGATAQNKVGLRRRAFWGGEQMLQVSAF